MESQSIELSIATMQSLVALIKRLEDTGWTIDKFLVNNKSVNFFEDYGIVNVIANHENYKGSGLTKVIIANPNHNFT
jgi:hypothetical protein